MRLVNGYSYRLVILNQTQDNYMILYFESQLMRYEHFFFFFDMFTQEVGGGGFELIISTL
jgi:hypothetical protein